MEGQHVIIMRGYITAGKTAVARHLAKEHKFAVLGMDYFTFAVLPYEPRTKDDLVLSFACLTDSLERCLDAGKSVIIEGDLNPIDDVDRFALVNGIAQRRGAQVHNVLITVSDEVAEERMKERKNPMPTERRHEMNGYIDARKVADEIVVDTSGRETPWSAGQVMAKLFGG